MVQVSAGTYRSFSCLTMKLAFGSAEMAWTGNFGMLYTEQQPCSETADLFQDRPDCQSRLSTRSKLVAHSTEKCESEGASVFLEELLLMLGNVSNVMACAGFPKLPRGEAVLDVRGS